MWDPHVIECITMKKYDQYIHGVVVKKRTDMVFYLAVIYGLHNIQHIMQIWHAWLEGLIVTNMCLKTELLIPTKFCRNTKLSKFNESVREMNRN